MSWSFTINDLDQFDPASQEWKNVVEYMATQHIAYPLDMMTALDMARKVGLKSATLTGMRTPNPVPDQPEVIDISIRGLIYPADFNQMIKNIIQEGPDNAPT